MQSLDDVVCELDNAFNNKNKEALLDFYEENSLLVIEPGSVAKGIKEISDSFDYAFKMNIKAEQIVTSTLETGDIGLFTSKWNAEGITQDGREYSNENIATSVFRKKPDGKWRLVIDNSFGPEILNH